MMHKRHKLLSGLAAFLTAAVFVSALPLQAMAAAPAWAAQELIRSDVGTVVMAPGELTEFTIGFKNVGQSTWRREGNRFVSAYTRDPNYRSSAFADHTWIAPRQPARLLEESVPPGGIGRIRFALQAPTVPGTFRETFSLAVEDLNWIPGGQFTVEIEVGEGGGNPAAGYRAIKLLTSADRLKIRAGETETFRVAFKNIGNKAWQKGGPSDIQLMAQAGGALEFAANGWNGAAAAALKDTEARPGAVSFFDMTLKAPPSAGSYTAAFSLAINGQPMPGGLLEIPIEVQGYAATLPSGAAVGDVDGRTFEPELSVSGPKGPNIRVGLFNTREPVVLQAEGEYVLIDGNHLPVRSLSGTTVVTFDFASRRYTVRNDRHDYTFEDDKHVHFRPADPESTIFEIVSHEDRAAWDRTVNYNRFRGQIDVHYIAATDRLWVVEELPVEDYMRGLAETSNGSPYEYQKALVTAARTFALFVVLIGGKHKSEFFDVDTTGNDQVYRGYVSETIRPQVVRAVEETRGLVVTYNGEIVQTPYFSRSDGRTRSWSEVWGPRHYPWLVSVPATFDREISLWGHGVGMSANDAYGRALHLGESWTQILKYYYTGVEIRRMY